MATHGKFGPFNPKLEPRACYSERLRYYFTSNEIAGPKKHAILLTVIGPQTFQLLRNLVQPKKLEDFSYDQLIEILTKHYDPAPSQIMQRDINSTLESMALQSRSLTMWQNSSQSVDFVDFRIPYPTCSGTDLFVG